MYLHRQAITLPCTLCKELLKTRKKYTNNDLETRGRYSLYMYLCFQLFAKGGGGGVVVVFEEFDEVGDVGKGTLGADFGDGFLRCGQQYLCKV